MAQRRGGHLPRESNYILSLLTLIPHGTYHETQLRNAQQFAHTDSAESNARKSWGCSWARRARNPAALANMTWRICVLRPDFKRSDGFAGKPVSEE
jgi:hypothetical protein